ncbi:MAG: DUF2281 domain-containing protein [Ignavibacteriota bacterium]
MEYKGLNNKFESLPAEAQKQVIAFIDFLKNKYEHRKKRSLEKEKITNKKFIGIWKDRVDFEKSSEWVRNIRKNEWGKINLLKN